MANLVGRDVRTTTGRNLAFLEDCSGLDPWIYGSDRLKTEILKKEVKEPPPMDQWRIKYLKDLLEQRIRLYYMGDREGVESVNQLIDS